jgi:hypothetical protein
MDSLQNGDSLVMLGSLVGQFGASLSTRALAFGKRNVLRKDFVTLKYGVFESKMAKVSERWGALGPGKADYFFLWPDPPWIFVMLLRIFSRDSLCLSATSVCLPIKPVWVLFESKATVR